MGLRWARTIDEKPHMFSTNVERDDDWLLYSGGWLIGRVYREGGGPGRGRILWSMTGPVAPEAPVPAHGPAETIAQGQELLVSAFAQWLAWAELQEIAPAAGGDAARGA